MQTPSAFGALQRQASWDVSKILAGATLAIYWLVLAYELRIDWQINAQYNYGWVVPLLTLGLVARRCTSRPAAKPGQKKQVVVWISSILLLLLLPIRLVREANPEWRLIYWLHGVQLLVLTGCMLLYMGGWPWIRHFGFAFAFFLIAIPWPMSFETAVVQGLMRQVATWTVAIADWLGIPAVQQGNLIETSSGLVGIDAACSGVRSLQTAFMVSLFLGELYRLSLYRRLGLLAAGLPLVV